MKLSVVVVFYDMTREAPRTLFSLSPAYQQHLATADYEVIAIDNGSTRPLDPELVTGNGSNFSYHFLDTASPSPVGAVNRGAELATGELLAVIVDGARMATPGLIGQTQRAAGLHPRTFVCALSWHLGPDIQRHSMLEGYDQTEEDSLLESIDWPSDGYRLFDVSTLAPSSRPGFLQGVPGECSWWAMRHSDFHELGGFEPRFESPGGGLVNQDFRDRALSLGGIAPVVLLGEGVFHQYHGGVSTNAAPDKVPSASYHAEYERIRGRGYEPGMTPPPIYYGSMPDSARRFMS